MSPTQVRRSVGGRTPVVLAVLAAAGWPAWARADEPVLHLFDRRQLTDVYYSEGAAAGDVDGDGQVDVIYGPYWFAGPDFSRKHEIYPPKPQPRERYADHFFAWAHDFNGDGAVDILVVGFPGKPACVYENPGAGKLDRHWTRHQVLDWVSNESPHFVDLSGDGRPELVCTRDGFFGYAKVDWDRPLEPWTFHPISDKIAPAIFGHGLGVGDLNGDGRADVLYAAGWFEQPPDTTAQPRWTRHEASFTTSYGGAEMHVYDVNGDGNNDVITSLAAHDFGLAWYEQVRHDGGIGFRQHLIMGSAPHENRYGVVFSELHSLALADIDGDGLKDIVTGKTYWSHHTKSPMWDAGAVVYWFRLVRTPEGVDWVPYRAVDDSGIGRQVGVFDINRDGLHDIIAGGMKGAHVLMHRLEAVDQAGWQAAQPKPFEGAVTRGDRGPPSVLDEHTSRAAGAIEGEAMKVLRATAGEVRTQKMTAFKQDRWSGGEQLFWTDAVPRARLDLEFDVPEAGLFKVAAVLTTARDYSIVNLLLDDQALCQPLDLFNAPDVRTTGLLEFGTRELSAGKHRLTLETIGANPAAVKRYMVGLDYLLLERK